MFGEKVAKVMELATRIGCPVIGINDSGGARIQEGVVSLAYYAELMRCHVAASGVVPQISVIVGPCAAAPCTPGADRPGGDGRGHLAHVRHRPRRDARRDRRGRRPRGTGRRPRHNTTSGAAHYLAQDEKDAFEYVRLVLGHLPSNNMSDAPTYPVAAERRITEEDRALDTLIPDQPARPYDMMRVVRAVVDDGELVEVQPLFAPNIICGFARVEGHSVGVVANQPIRLAGALDYDASEKAARFVRLCDAFSVPVLTLVDVPGFLTSMEQERGGIIRRGAKLLYAYCETTVPTVTVVTRKAYGGGYGSMGSKHLGVDVNLAWPTAEIAVMGGAGAVSVLHRRELAAAEDPEAERARLVEEYEETMCTRTPPPSAATSTR
ncbi:carboxyl transferase domain-containing protein [Streptomyces sp. M19]